MSGTSGSVAAATPDDEYEIQCDDLGVSTTREA